VVDAVVVRLSDLGDADRIVEVISREHGRLPLRARGGRASQRRFRGALDLFVSLRARCLARGDLWTLEAADVTGARLGIRGELARLRRANVLAEVAWRCANREEPVPEAYAALVDGLDALDQGELAAAAAAFPRLLAAAGIAPDTARCAACAAPRPALCRPDAASGGVLCGRCAVGASLPTAQLAGSEAPATAAAADALEAAVVAWMEAQLGWRVKSHHVGW
jgi:DNA repair protein RecO (recombination protein O)